MRKILYIILFGLLLSLTTCKTSLYKEKEVTKKIKHYVEHGVLDTLAYKVQIIVVDGDTIANDTLKINKSKDKKWH